MITKNEDGTLTETKEITRIITLDEIIQKTAILKERAENFKRERELQDSLLQAETLEVEEQITSLI